MKAGKGKKGKSFDGQKKKSVGKDGSVLKKRRGDERVKVQGHTVCEKADIPSCSSTQPPPLWV